MKKQVAQFVPYTDTLNLPIELPDITAMRDGERATALKNAVAKTKNVYFVSNGRIYRLINFTDKYAFTTDAEFSTERGAPAMSVRRVMVTFNGSITSDINTFYGTTKPKLSDTGSGTSWCFIPGTGAQWWQLSELPCLHEDSLITMADGTYKKVSEVKSGDEVLSYDIESRENTTTFVVNCYPTGFANTWDVNYFDNGNSIITYQRHAIYDCVNEVSKNIQDIETGFNAKCNGGNTVFISRKKCTSVSNKLRYNIVTANNLYYVNDILMANAPYQKYATITDELKNKLEPNVIEAWKNEYDAYYNTMTEGMTKEYAEEVAEIYKGSAKGKNKDKVRKEKNNNYAVRRKNEFKKSNAGNKVIKINKE